MGAEQIEQLSKMKAKIEKDKNSISHEIADVRAATDEIIRSKASAEKSNKNLCAQLNDCNKKVEEANLTLGDFENAKRKMAAENADLLRSVQELENNANMVSKYKIQLVSALDEAKKVADAEAKERQALLGKFKNLEHDLDGSKAMMDEESGAKDDILRQVAKACSEADMWRSKYENEAVAKAEDLEMTKLKLQACLSEAESTTEQLNGKLRQLDNAKNKIQGEINEVAAQCDQAHILNSSMEKKAIMDQISEGGRSIHEIDKIRKRLDAEKLELQAALEEAEGALEQEENKVLRAQLELTQVRQEIERRIAEKEEEFESTRKNFMKAIDGMQNALEMESKGKSEALRMKKKLEADVGELEMALEHANAANLDTQRTIKKYHQNIRESQAKLEDEQK